ncbi:MAG TPA: hypothetical protein VH082_07610 [Rudaea sp.]|jgi:hypothetical protein|nr:hypothetical protein [Rudaea sp.]
MSDREQQPRGEKKTFFGDFLPLSKKLPAACSGSTCSREPTAKALDSGFPGNYDQKFKAEFQLSLE